MKSWVQLLCMRLCALRRLRCISQYNSRTWRNGNGFRWDFYARNIDKGTFRY